LKIKAHKPIAAAISDKRVSEYRFVWNHPQHPLELLAGGTGVTVLLFENSLSYTMIAEIEVVSLGVKESKRDLDIQHSLQDSREQIGAVGVLIAATAAERANSRVLTRNVDEFVRVDQIDVETY